MTQPHPTPHVPQYRPWKVAVPLPGDADLSPETKELLSSLLHHARSSRDGSRFLQPVFVYVTTCHQQGQRRHLYDGP